MIKDWGDKVTINCWEHRGQLNEPVNCHPAWIKLVDSIDENLPHDGYEKAINIILKKYKAKMIRPSTYPHYMRFPNIKMAHWFLLEWL